MVNTTNFLISSEITTIFASLYSTNLVEKLLRKYSLKIFSSRADSEERITRFYIPQGNETIFKDIQTSGLADTVSGGNEKNLLEFQNVTADKGGAIHLDMVPIKGDFTYLNAFVLTQDD